MSAGAPIPASPRRREVPRLGLLLVGSMMLVALAGPFVAPGDPLAQDLLRALEGPSRAHPLGLDHLGRDMLARVLHGAPRSIGLALLCVTGATALGTALGLIAARGGRVTDTLVMRFSDLMLAFPGILLALLLAGFLGGGVLPMLVGIKLTLWPQFARMTRAVAIGVLGEPHVEAARLAGFPEHVILARHVLPSVLAQIAQLSTLGIGSAIMSISALGFLGLGLQPPIPEWGAMVSELLPYLAEAPVQMAAPCLAIFTTVLGFSLVGRAWAEAANRRESPP